RSQPDIILIGDSITHSWEDLGRSVWSDTFGRYPTLNLGFSGDRTENVLWRLQNGELPDNLQPALVILMIGTNNSGYRKDPPEHTAAGIRAILDELQARLPARTRILLLSILPRGSSRAGSAEWQRNDAVNQQIAHYADDHRIFYLDLSPRFTRPDGSMRTELMIDQYVHPNAAGYAAWAEAIQATVHSLIGSDG
ncbi:MAG: GDSL-type esterase/lipase family protein, partial [Coraliomargarita sp.]